MVGQFVQVAATTFGTRPLGIWLMMKSEDHTSNTSARPAAADPGITHV
jgi:hypothetical protein